MLPPGLTVTFLYTTKLTNRDSHLTVLITPVFKVLGRKPIFPGRDFKHQVEIICAILGRPSLDQMAYIDSENARKFISSLPDSPPQDFRVLFPDANEGGIDLLRKMLKFVPAERISAAQALNHPYVANYVGLRLRERCI
jgi:mitogen-activated protein kinase 1/3